jgi:hypothetical protein
MAKRTAIVMSGLIERSNDPLKPLSVVSNYLGVVFYNTVSQQLPDQEYINPPVQYRKRLSSALRLVWKDATKCALWSCIRSLL